MKSFCANENLAWKKKGLVTCTQTEHLANIQGFAAFVKKAPYKTVSHCFLSWHMPAIKTLPEILRGFLSTGLNLSALSEPGSWITTFLRNMSKRWKENLKFISNRSLPTFQGTSFKALDWTLSKEFKERWLKYVVTERI